MKKNQVISTAISVFKNKAFDGFELKNFALSFSILKSIILNQINYV
jgi:hypothetical protein